MSRRHFMKAGLAVAAGALFRVPAARAAPAIQARPGESAWPEPDDWAGLKASAGGRLSPVQVPDLTDPAASKLLANPFWLGDQAGLSQSSGWLDAWQATPGAYVVAAETAADIAAAVRFARLHRVRLVVRGGGHSYLGASTAPDSLMVWTRPMRQVTVHEAFTPEGSRVAPVPAVSLGAGCIWLDAYKAVTTGAGRYVQGGGCTTVGCAGLVQGGGFGSHSKAFGTAAASLLEAEVVTADGKVRIVNAHREPDLFWALKGGGGGTFGVITRLTLATHPLPETFGAVRLSIQAKSGEAYRRLLARFVDLYAAALHNPRWGEQAHFGPDNKLDVQMVFNGLTPAEARAAWQPLVDFCKASPADYEGADSLLVLAMPARHFWDAEFLKRFAPPRVIHPDDRPGGSPSDFWWSGDGDQVGVFWHAFASAWLPSSLLEAPNREKLVDAWYAASRHSSLGLHFNKGISGAPDAALAATRDTAMNPDVVDAFALAIVAAAGPPAFKGLPPPNTAVGRFNRKRVTACMDALRAAAPGAGAYVNECDFFQPDWQRAFWGSNYPRLEAVKRRYDPDGLFTVHHGVGTQT